MAAATAEVPLFSYGHSMTRVPRFRRTMKITKKEPITENREIKQSENDAGGALKKLGAFGISVRKSQLATEYAKNERVTSDRATSPIKEVPEDEEREELQIEDSDIKRLPTVEISIKKKIKNRIMLRHAGNTDALASSDRQVIEDLRQNLRTGTKEHGGTKSILEAIGDPKLREARLYYEPLTKFLSGQEKQVGLKGQRKIPFRKTTNGYMLNTAPGYTPDIGLLNVMVPPSQKHFNTPVGYRQAATSHSIKQPRNGAKHYPIFPKMQSLLNFGTKSEMRSASEHLNTKSSLDVAPEQINYSLSPSSVQKHEANENDRKTGFSLPSISLQMQQELAQNPPANYTQSPNKNPANFVDNHKQQRKPNTQPMESNAANRATRVTRPRAMKHQVVPKTTGYSPGGKLTATGKSHLIGPMNKMDMIVEYSRLLQDKVINYEQYTKKLSKLSLHKIDLGNSGLRQYHIVRDGTTGMKPRLARVDIHPTRKTQQQGHENTNAKSRNTTKENAGLGWTEILRRDATKTTEGRINQQRSITMAQSRNLVGSAIEIPSATPHETSSPYKSNNFRMSRISIGEEIPESRFEQYNTGYDVGNDEYLTYDDVIRMQGTDIDRYRHVHRPRNADKYNYHWNHLPPSKHMMYTSAIVNRTQSQEVAINANPPDELYNGFAGRLLQNSREVKRRLNFSYPSYNVMLDGSNAVSTAEIKPGVSSLEQDGKGADPDYLAITIDQPVEDPPKMTSSHVPDLTSSLSVHDVTIPTEVKVITGVIQPPKNNTTQKKNFDIKTNITGSNPLKGTLEGLNITPVAITSSDAVNPNPVVNKTPYFVSQDDFVSTGTDGVMQTHLSAIYRSINKAKGTKKEAESGPVAQPGKNSPPNVLITKMTTKTEPEPKIDKIISENAKLLQPSKRFPPPNTPPPKNVLTPSQSTTNLPIPQTLSVPKDDVAVTSEMAVTSSDTSLPVPKVAITDSPPPTAYLLQTREEEVTSVESDDEINEVLDVINVHDVIDVNVTAVSVE